MIFKISEKKIEKWFWASVSHVHETSRDNRKCKIIQEASIHFSMRNKEWIRSLILPDRLLSYSQVSADWTNKKVLRDGESNPGLPRDRRGYSPLYYRGVIITCMYLDLTMDIFFFSHFCDSSNRPRVKYTVILLKFIYNYETELEF